MMIELISSPRLTLREFCLADAAALHAIESDPLVSRYTTVDAFTLEDAKQRMLKNETEQAAAQRRVYELAVERRDNREVIGRVGMGIDRPEHREGRLWYVFSRATWGHGFGSEAVRALADYAFKRLELHRLYADCDPRNIASRRVAEKLGMRQEGVLRENWYLKGEWCDSVIYGLLASEWRGV